MPLVPEDTGAGQSIDSYGSGSFRVSGRVYACPVMVFADRVVEWPVEKPVDELSVNDLAEVLNPPGAVDILLLGCGARGGLIHDKLAFDLRRAGIAAEAMSTGAACRTYNLLASEGRRVAAALMPC